MIRRHNHTPSKSVICPGGVLGTLFRAAVRARLSADRFLTAKIARNLAAWSGDFLPLFLPFIALDMANRCSSVRSASLLPRRASLIFARASADALVPFLAAEIAARCSKVNGGIFLPSLIALSCLRATSDSLCPLEPPALG